MQRTKMMLSDQKYEPIMKKETGKPITTKIILVLSLLLLVLSVAMVTYILSNNSDVKNTNCKHHKEVVEIVYKTEETKIKDEKNNNDEVQTGEEELQGNIVSLWNDKISNHRFQDIKKLLESKLEKTKRKRAKYIISITRDSVVAIVALKPGWKRACHRHPVNFHVSILEGSFFIQTHEMKAPVISKPGDNIFIPKWQPHREGVAGNNTLYFVDTITPNVNPKNMTEMLPDGECSHHDLPPLQIPEIVTNDKPVQSLLPASWTATVLLHPFGEEQGVGPEEDYPFFQLSYGKVTYDSYSQVMLIHVKGCSQGEWWFKISGNRTNTSVSIDGNTWEEMDMGWQFPTRNWTDPEDNYVGHSTLNWMNDDQRFDWWKKNYRNTSTWTWFDRNNGGLPYRLMFSAPPAKSNFKGELDNLAFFQMYAFSYIVNFKEEFTKLEDLDLSDIAEVGLNCGNPENFTVFNWTHHFSMSAFMIPVDFQHNPYPTQVYYHWKYDQNYTGNPFDRSQSTVFYNNYNRFEPLETVRADLFGHWDGKEKRQGCGFLLKTSLRDWQTTCDVMADEDFPIAQQPPWWPSVGLAKIVAIIQKPEEAGSGWTSPLTNSNRTIAIIRVTFPPHLPNFPKSTSLWTWYDYTDYSKGIGEARPVVFMQSAPKFNLGTSLAVADFFDFKVLSSQYHSRTKLDLENLQQYCNFS